MHDRQTKRQTGAVGKLRDYMPQHWEKLFSSCTCYRNKVSLEFKCLSGDRGHNMSI